MDPVVGEIRIFTASFAPRGWAKCDGQLLERAIYPALFDVLGTAFGGDGTDRFALPDLRGRLVAHAGGPDSRFVRGARLGTETVVLREANLPTHGHGVPASSAVASSATPGQRGGGTPAVCGATIYSSGTASVELAAASCSSIGGGEPLDNVQPVLCCNFIIALGQQTPAAPR